jgi:hypothetical protein
MERVEQGETYLLRGGPPPGPAIVQVGMGDRVLAKDLSEQHLLV